MSDHLMKSGPEAWAETFSTNVSSQFFVAAAFLPLLARANDCIPDFTPSIINITSISG
jgi:NAD(P)-dependent dehydrogenase (short-subunit alcohol dehydrogenase family)